MSDYRAGGKAGENWLSGGSYFRDNPDKVLGEAKEASGRFGKVVKYEATEEELQEKMGSLPVANAHATDIGISVVEAPPLITNHEVKKNITHALEQAPREIAQKKKLKKEKEQQGIDIPETFTPAEIYHMKDADGNLINSQISPEELQAFIWYKETTGDRLAQVWYDIAGIQGDAQDIDTAALVKANALFYLHGKLLPYYQYFNQSVYSLKANIEADRDEIIKTYGQQAYDAQLKKVLELFHKYYDYRFTLNPVGTQRQLVLNPLSEMVKEIKVTSLKEGSIDFGKKSDDTPVERHLLGAFKYWIARHTTTVPLKNDKHQEYIIDYLNFKRKPKNYDEDLWRSLKAVGKSEAERLFHYFLREIINAADRVKIETYWNDRFYARPPIDYDKVPVLFTAGKTFYGAPFSLRWEKREAAAFALSEGTGIVAYGVGFGKAEWVENEIFTPTGVKKMKDIEPGDFVMGSDGKPTKVLATFPQGHKEMFRVHFSDKSSVVVCGEHLWQVQTKNHRFNELKTNKSKKDGIVYADKNNPHYVFSTKQILEKGIHNYRGDAVWCIPMTKPVEFKQQNVWIEPYMLGVLLGDGGLSNKNSVTLTSADAEIVESISESIPKALKLHKKGYQDKYNYYITRRDIKQDDSNVLLTYLKHYGLSGKRSFEKHIPEEYKYNSVDVRIKLLQGLMDTDGYMIYGGKRGKTCTVQYITTSKQLSDDITFIVQSLGGTVTLKEVRKKFTYKGEKKTGRLAYMMTFRLPPEIHPFKLKRKADLHIPKTKYQPIRFITKIEPAGLLEAKCIKVAAENSLYLTEKFIVTHNTISQCFIISTFLDAGWCKRPCIIVPKRTYNQWVSELRNAIPQVQIIQGYNLSQAQVYELQDEDGNIKKIPEGSVLLLTYEGMDNLAFKEESRSVIERELYSILSQGDENQQEESALWKRIQKASGKAQKKGVVYVEDLGIDFVGYDEAHALKKLFTDVRGGGDDGSAKSDADDAKQGSGKQYHITSGSQSDTAIKGFYLASYIQHRNNDRNIFLLTATPFTNSPLEIYSMLVLVARKKLQEMGIYNLKQFFDVFVHTSYEMVVTATLKVERKEVVLGFNALPALQDLIFRFLLFRDADMPDEKGRIVKLSRPNKIVVPYTHIKTHLTDIKLQPDEQISSRLELSPLQKQAMARIRLFAEGKIGLTELCPEVIEKAQSQKHTEEELMGMTILQLADIANDYADEFEDAFYEDWQQPRLVKHILTKQRELAKFLQRANDMDAGDKKTATILQSVSFSRDLCLSPYLFKCVDVGLPLTPKNLVETSPKLHYIAECIRTRRNHHLQTGTPVSGAIIYMDRGKKMFPLLRKYLIDEVGYEPHEVQMIYSAMPGGAEKANQIKDSFNGQYFNEKTGLYESIPHEQRVKVIIGTSTIAEGLNLQRHTSTLYVGFLEWNPTVHSQISGRGWRQGNLFKYYTEVYLLMEDSMDIFMFQKLLEKTSRINAIFNRDGSLQYLDTREFDPKELQKQLIRDPETIANIERDEMLGVIEEKKAIASIRLSDLRYLEGVIAEVKDAREKLAKEVRDVRPAAAERLQKENKLNDANMIRLLNDAIKTQAEENGIAFQLSPKRQRDYRFQNEEYSGFWGYDVFLWKRNVVKNLVEKYLVPMGAVITDIPAVVHSLLAEIARYDDEIMDIKNDEWLATRVEEINKERKAAKMFSATVMERVAEFKKLNHLLDFMAPVQEKKTPVLSEINSACPALDEKGNRRIDATAIELLETCIANMASTKMQYADADGEYMPERMVVQDAIIADIKKNIHCVERGAPIAILTGGLPGAGKTYFIEKHGWSWLNSKNIVRIDEDKIKEQLPEYAGWNDAAYHLEARDMIARFLNNEIANPCKYDLLYDGTMNQPQNYLPLIGMLKKLGYKIFIIYVQAPYKMARERVLKRYVNTGRYVPEKLMQEMAEQGTAAFDELKKKVSGWMLVNGINGTTIDKGGVALPEDRKYKLAEKTKQEEQAEIKAAEMEKQRLAKEEAERVAKIAKEEEERRKEAERIEKLKAAELQRLEDVRKKQAERERKEAERKEKEEKEANERRLHLISVKAKAMQMRLRLMAAQEQS